ncbi:MAG: DNA-binding protein WhiA [Bacilli bacterium]
MRPSFSFTRKVKEEIVIKPYTEERLRSLIAAFIRINGVTKKEKGQKQLILKTENAKIAKFIFLTVQKIYGLQVRFAYEKMMKFKKRTIYKIIFEQEVDYLLSDLEVSFSENKIAKNIVYNDDMIGGYLAGGFLASGSVNSPTSSNYHLEIALKQLKYARWFLKLIAKYKGGAFSPKTIKRRDKTIIYLKKSDQIADFLILMGATECALEFENIRIDREFINIGNRLINLDKANYAKTTEAALKQLANISVIQEKLGLQFLANEKLKLLCQLRLMHRDATLDELARHMSERLEKVVSKSNVNHLFRELNVLATRYKGEEE